jgi:NAD-dependent deacetylase
MRLFEIPIGLIDTLHAAQHVAVLTGAGVSAESGVPTFRDAQTGLWARYRPEDLATPEAFQRDPKRVWQWYAWRREIVSGVKPNSGHNALAEMERHVPQFALITQNIDELHQQAGSTAVIELHGSIHRTKCSRRRS